MLMRLCRRLGDILLHRPLVAFVVWATCLLVALAAGFVYGRVNPAMWPTPQDYVDHFAVDRWAAAVAWAFYVVLLGIPLLLALPRTPVVRLLWRADVKRDQRDVQTWVAQGRANPEELRFVDEMAKRWSTPWLHWNPVRVGAGSMVAAGLALAVAAWFFMGHVQQEAYWRERSCNALQDWGWAYCMGAKLEGEVWIPAIWVLAAISPAPLGAGAYVLLRTKAAPPAPSRAQIHEAVRAIALRAAAATPQSSGKPPA